MQTAIPSTGTVRPLDPLGQACAAGDDPSAATRVRVTIDADDRNSRRVVSSLEALRGPGLEVVVRDAREDPGAAGFLDRLVCCGQITPVVEVRGLLLTAPTPAEALLAVRRVAGGV